MKKQNGRRQGREAGDLRVNRLLSSGVPETRANPRAWTWRETADLLTLEILWGAISSFGTTLDSTSGPSPSSLSKRSVVCGEPGLDLGQGGREGPYFVPRRGKAKIAPQEGSAFGDCSRGRHRR